MAKDEVEKIKPLILSRWYFIVKKNWAIERYHQKNVLIRTKENNQDSIFSVWKLLLDQSVLKMIVMILLNSLQAFS